MGFFKKTFDDYIGMARKARDRQDFPAAVRYAFDAVKADPTASEKMENLLWELIEGEDSHDSSLDLDLFAQCYNGLQPGSCVGWIASAKTALKREAFKDFETFIETADALVADRIPNEEVVGISLCIYNLRNVHHLAWRDRVDEIDMAYIEKLGESWKMLSHYAGIVLSRIEAADKETPLKPAVWKWYLQICKDYPLHKSRAALAHERLGPSKSSNP